MIARFAPLVLSLVLADAAFALDVRDATTDAAVYLLRRHARSRARHANRSRHGSLRSGRGWDSGGRGRGGVTTPVRLGLCEFRDASEASAAMDRRIDQPSSVVIRSLEFRSLPRPYSIMPCLRSPDERLAALGIVHQGTFHYRK